MQNSVCLYPNGSEFFFFGRAVVRVGDKVGLVFSAFLLGSGIACYFSAPLCSAIVLGGIGVGMNTACIVTIALRSCLETSQTKKLTLQPGAIYRSEKALVCPVGEEGQPPKYYLKLRRRFDLSQVTFSGSMTQGDYDAVSYWLDHNFYYFDVVPKTYLYTSLEDFADRWEELIDLRGIEDLDWHFETTPKIFEINQYRKGTNLYQTADGRFVPSKETQLTDTTCVILQEAVDATTETPRFVTHDTPALEKQILGWIQNLELGKTDYLAALFFNLLMGRRDNGIDSLRNSKIVQGRVIEFDNDQTGADISTSATRCWLLKHPLAERNIPKKFVHKVLALQTAELQKQLKSFELRFGLELNELYKQRLINNLALIKARLQINPDCSAKTLCQSLFEGGLS